MKNHPTKLWDWYSTKFNGKEKLIKGEDSTTYLASKVAAKRISLQQKPIKLIFILRNPTLRSYSNYWHLLVTGRATFTFEDTIRYNPFSILNRSLYKEQLENFYSYIPKERIKVILFEELISIPRVVLREVSEFLGIDFEEFPEDVFDLHSNKGRLPNNLTLQIKKNQLMRSFGNMRYFNSLPIKPDFSERSNSLIFRIINFISHKINPLNRMRIPDMNEGTKNFLDNYFYQELHGLDELVGKDLLSKWF